MQAAKLENKVVCQSYKQTYGVFCLMGPLNDCDHLTAEVECSRRVAGIGFPLVHQAVLRQTEHAPRGQGLDAYSQSSGDLAAAQVRAADAPSDALRQTTHYPPCMMTYC